MVIQTTTIRQIRKEDLEEYVNTLNQNLKIIGSPNKIDVEALKNKEEVSYTDSDEYTSATTKIKILRE